MNTEDSFDLIINNCQTLFNKKMLDYGIDGIISDEIEILKSVFEERKIW